MKNYILVLFSLNFLFAGHAIGQSLVPVSKITKDSISIKWLPNNFEQFKELLTNEVSVKRKEIDKNAVIDQLDFSSTEAITIENGKKNYDKLKEELWFQESFEILLSPYFEGGTEEIQENYAFALSLVANLSKPSFQFICGNIFIDKYFDKRKLYAYEISAGGETFRMKIDPSEITKYESVDFELALDKKKTVDITWESKKYNQDFFGFEIKKAIKNKEDLANLKDEAYLPFRSNFEKDGTSDFVRDDSLVQGEYHYYSISGVDLFGHEQPSDIVKKIYVPKLTNSWIQIDTIEADGYIRNVKAIIHPTGDVSHINLDEIQLLRSKKRDSNFEMIKSTGFNNTDTLVDFSAEVPLKTGDAYYYKIVAFNDDKDSVFSLPHYFFSLDQEPPSSVTSLSGKIDSTGIVDLKWEAPEDKDLLGYRVFRANAKHEEFTEKTTRLTLDLAFRDTISLDNLTSEVYYFVSVVDSNYNNSSPSDTILIIKPDTIAPIPAVIKSVRRTDTVIKVEWINSTSSDFKTQALIRTTKSTSHTDTILNWSDSTIIFEDHNASAGNYNSYQIITWDKSENIALSNKFELFFEPGYRKAIDSFEVKVLRNEQQIKLSWNQPNENVFSYKIFKGSSKDDLSLLKTIETTDNTSFSDIDISINNQYYYAIKYITKEGIHSIPSVRKVVY